jgi:hypothetical protein
MKIIERYFDERRLISVKVDKAFSTGQVITNDVLRNFDLELMIEAEEE